MDKGALVLSLDLEMAWGRLNDADLSDFFPLFERVPQIVPQTLELFEAHEAPATWAVVGRLMHPPSPDAKPPLDRYTSGPQLVEAIRSSSVAHEIASHSFTHPLFDRLERSRAQEEIERAVETAAGWGLRLHSFVFPQNRVAHLDVLAENGFTAFRGPDRVWFEQRPPAIRKALRQIDTWLALKPMATRPRMSPQGLVDIAGHMLFRIQHRGLRRLLPVSAMAAKAVKGIQEAVEQRAVFHLWWHPFNFGFRNREHLEGLDRVLRFASQERSRGRLEILTMAEVASRQAA